eukprot:scaffold549_cov385-Prasinococcus_capsulatus_cf.AAC.31
MLVAEVMEREGYVVQPTSKDSRHDVIQVRRWGEGPLRKWATHMRADWQGVKLGTAEKLVKYCSSLQATSPVGAYITPTPGSAKRSHAQSFRA